MKTMKVNALPGLWMFFIFAILVTFGFLVTRDSDPSPSASFDSAVMWAGREGIRARSIQCVKETHSRPGAVEQFHDCFIVSGLYAYPVECSQIGCKPAKTTQFRTDAPDIP